MSATTTRAALVAIQLSGLVLSAFLVAVTYLEPVQVEDRVRQFAVAKVEREAERAWRHEVEGAGEGSRAEALEALGARLGLEAETIDIRRQELVPALLAFAKSRHCVENCEFRAASPLLADVIMTERIAGLRLGQTTLGDFVAERYETSVRGLLMDLRRFGTVNVIVLSLMTGLVTFRKLLHWRFAAFSAAVTGYAAWAACGYIFNQDWALSILMQDWASTGYQAGMIFTACLFFDWLVLRGGVTQIVSAVLGSILSAC